MKVGACITVSRRGLGIVFTSVYPSQRLTEGGDAVFTLTASPAPSTPLAVTLAVATTGGYGVSAGARTVTVPTGGSATLTLPTTNDAMDEPDGSVSATVKDGNGYTVGSPGSGSVAIHDDDGPPPATEPAISIAAISSPVTEGGDAALTLTASPAPSTPLAVSVTVKAGSGYGVGSPASGSIAVLDDDLPARVISIAAKAALIAEGGNALFTLTADRVPASGLAVRLTVSETGGDDHVAAAHEGARTVTMVRGETSAEVAVPMVNDAMDEPDGAVTATLKGGDGYTLGGASSAQVKVADNDETTGPALIIEDATGREGT